MKKNIYSKFICVMFSVFIFSMQLFAINEYQITKDVLTYKINKKTYYCINYEIHNKSTNLIYLWVDKKDNLQKADSTKIENYFYKREDGQISLFQIGMDIGYDYIVADFFKTFVKKIQPSETFTIQIIRNEQFSTKSVQAVYEFLDKCVIIFPQEKLNLYKKGKSINDLAPFVFFKNTFIVLPYDKLMECKK
ncbi:MAG: hypothetical protein PHR83_12765 [Paludibacter sp.]|nr:hypothetical protein [Paludibacter sp.]